MERDYVLFTDTDTDATPAVAEELGYSGLISMPYIIDGKEIFPYEDFAIFNAKGVLRFAPKRRVAQNRRNKSGTVL